MKDKLYGFLIGERSKKTGIINNIKLMSSLLGHAGSKKFKEERNH